MPVDYWSKKEDKILKKNPNAPFPELQRLLPRRSKGAITKRLWRVGESRDRDVKEWQDFELRILLEMYNNCIPMREISSALKRSVPAIKCKASALGLQSIRIERPILPGGVTRIDSMVKGKTMRFGVASDRHFGCFHSRARVKTKNGDKVISKIKKGDEVLTHKNHFRKVTHKFKNPVYKEIKFHRLWFLKGGHTKTISATEEHHILINRKGIEKWVPIKHIVEGDFVLSVPTKCHYCNELIPYWRKTCNTHDAYNKISMTVHKKRWMDKYKNSKQEHYYKHILPYAKKLQIAGYRTIPIGLVYPDIIAIKNNKVIAYEIENKPECNHTNKHKYTVPEIQNLYDEIRWIYLKKKKRHNWRYEHLPPNKDGFIGIKVVSVDSYMRYIRYTYNLEVKEDKTYIVNNCVVHNSIYSQISYLHKFYGQCEKEGVDFILDPGDTTEGDGTHYRGQRQEMHIHDKADELEDFVVRNYPRFKNRSGKLGTTYGIAGYHDLDLYVKTGNDLLKSVATKREDYQCLGHASAILNIHGIKIQLLHPAGGSSYAFSYKIQKIVEGFSSENKPHMLVVGHFHKAEMMPILRNIFAIQAACFIAQTPFAIRKGLTFHYGGWIIEISMDKGSITRRKGEFVPFYHPIVDDWRSYVK